MVNYRRNKTGNPADVYFIVFNTFNRYPWIKYFNYFSVLVKNMTKAENVFKISFEAWAILPDHIHWLIKPGRADYSNVVSSYKKWATWDIKARGLNNQGEKLWQDRFWEETIRDDAHFNECLDYIHYNPVKHGLVDSPKDWEHSSFGKYVESGVYGAEWSAGDGIVLPGSAFD